MKKLSAPFVTKYRSLSAKDDADERRFQYEVEVGDKEDFKLECLNINEAKMCPAIYWA